MFMLDKQIEVTLSFDDGEADEIVYAVSSDKAEEAKCAIMRGKKDWDDAPDTPSCHTVEEFIDDALRAAGISFRKLEDEVDIERITLNCG